MVRDDLLQRLALAASSVAHSSQAACGESCEDLDDTRFDPFLTLRRVGKDGLLCLDEVEGRRAQTRQGKVWLELLEGVVVASPVVHVDRARPHLVDRWHAKSEEEVVEEVCEVQLGGGQSFHALVGEAVCIWQVHAIDRAREVERAA